MRTARSCSPRCRVRASTRGASRYTSCTRTTRTSTRSRGLAARHLVDADGRGQEQRVVLSRRDLNPVPVAAPAPALGDLRHLDRVALDLVLVIDDVALGAQLGVVLYLDREAVPQRRDQRLLDRRHRVPIALDFHGVADVQLLLLDLEELITRWALQDERLTDAESFSVDLERALPVLGLDPIVVADREQLPAPPVARPTRLVVSP